MIDTAVAQYSVKPWILEDDLSSIPNESYDHWCKIAAIAHQAAKMDLMRLESFLSKHAALDDHSWGLRSFQLIVDELKSEYDTMISAFDCRSTLRSIEMAKVSIDESRATIRRKYRFHRYRYYAEEQQ